ncbi:MAG TPA: type I DNA topoisomerase [Actinomycetota bacterium]|nr:type I DNA topoisomerase [Actinomycetota bacterium]
MAKNLVIVESPAKAKTIEKYMGKDYKVLASMGHVRDLPKSAFGIEVNGGVTIAYEAIKRATAKKAVSEIRKAIKDAEMVWLAPDPDREGEAIAWHIAELTKLKPATTQRVSFNEITKKAVTEAFANPRSIDMNLVDAQQARRAVDRIVGYKLSPLLWRNVGPNLSAGRVQSASLLLVVVREREIRAFTAVEYWDVTARLATTGGDEFTAVHPVGEKEKFSLPTGDAAQALTETVRPGPWVIEAVRKTERKKNPPAPFKTSTLQQAASSKLGFPTWKTMQVAQRLYEAGHITYMRTDSTNLSAEALGEIGRVVEGQFGKSYHQVRKFTAKSKGAQEAHEAIRPASAAQGPGDIAALPKDEARLYEMIWQRTMASQMAEALYDATSVDIASNGVTFRATGQVLKFDGFMRVYLERSDDDPEEAEGLLPELAEGDVLDLKALDPEQHFTQPPARFTEATLVKKMEEVGIGRPSTYAPTVQKLVEREYLKVESRRLFPTLRGEVVTELMETHFPEIVDVEFTARMEEELDEIAEGTKEMVPIVKAFHNSFISRVEEQGDKMSRPERPTDKVCPECGRPVVQKFGKHGLWFLSCTGWPDDCKWSQQLDEAGEPLPDPEGTGEKCPECGSELVAKSGRFGPFVGCSNYPGCKYIKKEPPKETGEACPNCGSPLVEKRGRFGPFTGCSKYPECKFIKKDPKGAKGREPAEPPKETGEACPECGSPLVEKKNRWGTTFVGCSNYPTCKHIKKTDDPATEGAEAS